MLLGFSWPPNYSYALLFLAFVPLLIIDKYTENTKKGTSLFLFYTFLSLLLWSIISTDWLFQIVPAPSIVIYMVTSLLTLLPFFLFKVFKNQFGKWLSYFALIAFYLSYEFLIQRWDLAYPYLLLGNGLSTAPYLVQWYEYTGVLGGSLWVLAVNILLYSIITTTHKVKNGLIALTVVIIPISVSFYITPNSEIDEKEKTFISVLHSSVDARSVKYNISTDSLISRYAREHQIQPSEKISLIVWPESALPDAGWIEDFSISKELNSVRTLTKKFDADIVTGFIATELVDKNSENPTPLIQETANGLNYRSYNGAILIKSSSDKIRYRTKQKLVPIEETIPYPKYLSFLRNSFGSLGGFMISHRQKNKDLFVTSDKKKFVYLICYESIFADFTRKLVKNGAQFIVVGLNESWYNNIKPAEQFMNYNRLRAIENRRYVVRSSNDGISCIIDTRGEVIAIRDQAEDCLMTSYVIPKTKKTLFNIFGDWIGLLSLVIAIVLLIALFYAKILKT